jgi:hypothetical protein
VNRGVPEEDALLLAEELRHRAELPDFAGNLAARIEEQTHAGTLKRRARDISWTRQRESTPGIVTSYWARAA